MRRRRRRRHLLEEFDPVGGHAGVDDGIRAADVHVPFDHDNRHGYQHDAELESIRPQHRFDPALSITIKFKKKKKIY